MIYRRLVLMLLVLILSGTAQGQFTQHSDKQEDVGVMILPFGWDNSPSSDAISTRASWMLRRHLRSGRYELPEVKERTVENGDVTWTNRKKLVDYFKENKINWVIGGDIRNVSRDKDGKWTGPHVFGVAGIPIKCEIKIKVFHVDSLQDVWETSSTVNGSVHRLRVFGMNRDPYPETPSAIDSFIHDPMYDIAQKIIDQISHSKNGGK